MRYLILSSKLNRMRENLQDKEELIHRTHKIMEGIEPVSKRMVADNLFIMQSTGIYRQQKTPLEEYIYSSLSGFLLTFDAMISSIGYTPVLDSRGLNYIRDSFKQTSKTRLDVHRSSLGSEYIHQDFSGMVKTLRRLSDIEIKSISEMKSLLPQPIVSRIVHELELSQAIVFSNSHRFLVAGNGYVCVSDDISDKNSGIEPTDVSVMKCIELIGVIDTINDTRSESDIMRCSMEAEIKNLVGSMTSGLNPGVKLTPENFQDTGDKIIELMKYYTIIESINAVTRSCVEDAVRYLEVIHSCNDMTN